MRIQLNDVDPVIWRRLLVPGAVRMAKLADMLIAGMGYGMNFDEYPEGEIDEKSVTVLQSLRDERRFTFDYDFGDSWEHDVVIEELTWSYFGLKYAVCIDGANACPPEDVGGVYGYVNFLEAINDPDHEEFDDYTAWIDGPFDPAEFDLGEVNALLQKVR